MEKESCFCELRCPNLLIQDGKDIARCLWPWHSVHRLGFLIVLESWVIADHVSHLSTLEACTSRQVAFTKMPLSTPRATTSVGCPSYDLISLLSLQVLLANSSIVVPHVNSSRLWTLLELVPTLLEFITIPLYHLCHFNNIGECPQSFRNHPCLDGGSKTSMEFLDPSLITRCDVGCIGLA